MKLILQRTHLDEKSTQGEMLIDGHFAYFTLELPVKDGKPGSAIPPGTYPVKAEWSPRFGRTMPHLENIPGRSTILIHYGNHADDTNGCILLGNTRDLDFVGDSRLAFDSFYREFMQRVGEGVTIEVQGGIPQAPADLSLQGDV